MRTLPAALVACLILLTPLSLQAWGMDVHRWITRRSVEGLPPELKPYFLSKIEFFSEHSVDPDLWRPIGLRSDRGDEDPNHFLDIDGLDDPRPFTNVPRDWDAYVAKYGRERADKAGRVPWRAEDLYKLVVTRFQEAAKNPAGYGAENAVYAAAVLAHYIEDSHQPFHAVANYNGQLTNQVGVHGRFETQLVARYRDRLTLAPVKLHPIGNMKDFIFKTIIDSEGLSGAILEADRKAAAGREFYDDAYFAALFKSTQPVLERRLSDAASAVASAIVAAWTEAGKPAMPTGAPQPPARIRR
jgi:hypothetical protein